MAAGMYSWFPFRRPAPSSPDHPDNVDEKLEWLGNTLRGDKSKLDAVEARPYLEAQTEMWKNEIKRWAYDAEDLIDEWKFEQLRAEVDPTPPPISSSRRDPHADHSTDHPPFRRRVDDLKLRREAIDEFNRTLRLGSSDPWQHRPTGKSMATSSLPLERVIHGREDDKEIIVKFLLEEQEERLGVVPILGAAGVGKTSLVQDIFNDPHVSRRFSSAWVSSSRGRQVTDLNKAIGESLTIRDPGADDDQSGKVLNPLKRNIEGQKLLLVLDDVGYESIDGDLWEELLDRLGVCCAHGSVIILTTQDEKVAETTGTVPPYMLESLTGDLCRSVFLKHAFSGSLPTDGRLVDVGEKIAKECQGSPLVAKALGLRLRHERDVEYWKEFLETDMWDEVVPELKLSYHRLPAHLKRCFVYCSMFPRGYFFNREELVQMWIAQGFVQEESERSLEDVGMEYFDELWTLSFFQRSELDAGAFVMPNLLHALAECISDGECITTENSNLGNIPGSDLQKARHLSLKPSDGELSTAFHFFTAHLRSFLVVPKWPMKNVAHISLSDEAFHSLNRLRVLDVRHTDIVALPETVGNLKHLRYLNLSGTKLEHVCPSVCKLYNLQTLDLSCTDVRELPGAIGNLSNLRRLRLNVTKITRFPESIGKLSRLQTLHLGWTKTEEFPESAGAMSVEGDSQLNGQSGQILPNQALSDMADSSLYIDGGSSSNDAIREQTINENLQPHTNLQMSDERFYHDDRLLMWMGSPLFSELTYVVINDCMQCTDLPQLGQLQRLKELQIDGMLVKHVGEDFCGIGGQAGFPTLEKLSFENMSEWEKWNGAEEGDFPELVELILFNCPKLKEVPHLHSPLIKLKVERCAVKSVPAIDSVQVLELVACDNLVTLPPLTSLQNLTLMYCQNLKFSSLPKNFWIEDCEQLKTCLPNNLKISSTTFYQMISVSELSDP